MSTLATLQSYIDLEYHLTAHCSCGHHSVLDKQMLARRLGPDYDVVQNCRHLQWLLKCTRCGKRATSVTVGFDHAERSQSSRR